VQRQFGGRTVSDVTRVHIDVPDDVHRAAKLAAVRRGVSLKAWVTEAIEEKAEREGEPPQEPRGDP
jgi:predicted HicB family RNase H-like nuclease